MREDYEGLEYQVLRISRHHTRKERKLRCGHVVPKDTEYKQTVSLVDQQFTVDHECVKCWGIDDVDAADYYYSKQFGY